MREQKVVVCYLFTNDWSKEFDDFRNGKVPSHRLFWAKELENSGLSIIYCRWPKCIDFFRNQFIWKVWQAIWALSVQKKVDIFFAVSEAAGLPSLITKLAGLQKKPICVVSIAVIHRRYRNGVLSSLRRRAIAKSEIVFTLASSHVSKIIDLLNISPQKVRFLPMGIDSEFFQPQNVPETIDVLSVGTNEGKDFPTLLRALPDGISCNIITDKENENIIKFQPNSSKVQVFGDVPILQLREMYASSRLIVIPLREMDILSGQTVLLECQSMGKIIIVTDVPGIRDYAVYSGRTLMVKSADSAALRILIEKVLTGKVVKGEMETFIYTAENTGRLLFRELMRLVNKI